MLFLIEMEEKNTDFLPEAGAVCRLTGVGFSINHVIA